MSEFLQVLTPALIGAIPALIIAINTNRLIAYRVDELTKKVEKHNQVIEKTFKLESDLKTMWAKYDVLKDDIIEIKDDLQYIKQQLHIHNNDL